MVWLPTTDVLGPFWLKECSPWWLATQWESEHWLCTTYPIIIYNLSYLNIPTFFKGCCSNHLRKWYFLCHPKHPSNQHLLQDAARRIALMRYIQIQELHGDIPMQVGEVRWLVLCMNDPSKNPLNNLYILVEMFAHFLVVFYRNKYIIVYCI